MNTRRLPMGLAGMACIGTVFAALAFAAPADKVELCHVPPDDPAGAHTITVSLNAANSHMENHPGDKLGPCPPTCADAAACDDGNLCTKDICTEAGLCDNSPVDCSDGNQCTADICDPALGCLNQAEPAGLPCDDGSDCTTGDQCVIERGISFYCQGFAVDCSCLAPDDPIWSSTVNGHPVCDDGNACTHGDACAITAADDFGRCQGVFDPGPCNRCDPVLGPLGTFCSVDGDCGSGEACLDGCCELLP